MVDVVPYAAKTKRKTAEMTVELANVPRRPKKGDGWSTRYAARRLPGIPITDVMA